jgi:hypothetical protein
VSARKFALDLFIGSTLAADLPSSNFDSNQLSTQHWAYSFPTTRSTDDHHLAIVGPARPHREYTSWQTPARIQATLSTVMTTPIPVPHIRIVRSCWPPRNSTRNHEWNIRVQRTFCIIHEVIFDRVTRFSK